MIPWVGYSEAHRVLPVVAYREAQLWSNNCMAWLAEPQVTKEQNLYSEQYILVFIVIHCDFLMGFFLVSCQFLVFQSHTVSHSIVTSDAWEKPRSQQLRIAGGNFNSKRWLEDVGGRWAPLGISTIA